MEVFNFIKKYRMPLLVATILILAVFYLSKDIEPVSFDTLLGKK